MSSNNSKEQIIILMVTMEEVKTSCNMLSREISSNKKVEHWYKYLLCQFIQAIKIYSCKVRKYLIRPIKDYLCLILINRSFLQTEWVINHNLNLNCYKDPSKHNSLQTTTIIIFMVNKQFLNSQQVSLVIHPQSNLWIS